MKTMSFGVGLLAVIISAGMAFAQEDGAKGQDENKKKRDQARGAVPGVPTVKMIAEKLELGEEDAAKLQKKESEAVTAFKDIRKKARESGDRKAMRKAFVEFRTKTVASYRECLPEDKQEAFDELVKSSRPQRKKKDGADTKKKENTDSDKKEDADSDKKDESAR